jgi:hypothetical protein
MTPEEYDNEHDHTVDDDTPRYCEWGCAMDEDVGDCLDCGMEWQEEGRHLHFGASGMFCCSCAESRRNGDRYVY